jgi:protein-disulfide isomerase
MKRVALAAAWAAMSTLSAEQRLIEGSPASSVRVIVYEDLQCPDCAVFRRMLDEQLLPKYGALVAFEHRDFPLAKHAWARKEAIAARFFEEVRPALGLEFRRYAFAHIGEVKAGGFSGVLAQFSKEHNLHAGKAEAALNDPRLAALVEKDYQDGVARGIAHTPTVLVNGQPYVETFRFEEIAKGIDAELAASK